MGSTWTRTFALLASCGGLAACSGGSGEEPINTDYSALRLAPSHEGVLHYATSDEQLLRPLRNGLRMSLVGMPEVAAVSGLSAPRAAAQNTFSATTVQVAGVDEADLVKYDGQYIYSMRPDVAPAIPGFTRNVLTIARTHPDSATTEIVSEFELQGEQSALPQLYQLQSAQGATQYLVAVSQNYGGWLLPQPALAALFVRPDRTRIQLLDVRDPANVSQAWEIEIDGWLRASRKIDDVLYLVNSYRPRLGDFALPADTAEKKQANELRIRQATARDLLPGYSENGGADRQLLAAGDCVLPAELGANDAYSDLVVITAISLTQRRISDVNCISTEVNGVYMSHDSLYVGGQGVSIPEGTFTVLHKFALDGSAVDYRASGVIGGQVGWQNASYFMDEHGGDLRILTSQFQPGGESVHRLHVLREGSDHELTPIATLPNSLRTAPIGKPGEQVHAVRFFGDRAYVVTARVVDPLYVIDLSVPDDPVIAGSLEIPGVSTYLQPIGPAGGELVLTVGGQTNDAGVRDGVKIELFDVHDILRPRSVGSHVFGRRGSSSEATADPHALTLLPQPAVGRLRIALPIDVFATPRAGVPDLFDWTYSGSHLLEVDGIGGSAPQLAFKGVITTAEPAATDPFPSPPYVVPRRAVMHDDAVFVVDGATLIGRQWDGVTQF
ncbi:MAG TPA: beta-propeller domain-containing protein [Steroidobacteraceae bacterium]|nr:beta-propeller domain-containing protein [Steroidobacteraceae bacterium]